MIKVPQSIQYTNIGYKAIQTAEIAFFHFLLLSEKFRLLKTKTQQ